MTEVNWEQYFATQAEGSTNWEISISLKNYREWQASGHLPPGKYEAVCKGATIEGKKGGKTGKNIHVVLESVGPKAFAKVLLHTWIPCPLQIGDTGYNKLQQFSYSSLSARGQLEAALNTDTFMFGGKRMVDQRVFVLVCNGKGEYAKYSEVDGFISKNEYEASPGPSDNGVSTEIAQAQTVTPELVSGNASQKDAINQVLFGA